MRVAQIERDEQNYLFPIREMVYYGWCNIVCACARARVCLSQDMVVGWHGSGVCVHGQPFFSLHLLSGPTEGGGREAYGFPST